MPQRFNIDNNILEIEVGKLYRVINELEVYRFPSDPALIQKTNLWTGWDDLSMLYPDTLFVFLGYVKIKNCTYSKVLVNDAIYVTHNQYHKFNSRYIEKYE